jgi:hypothetical protein
MYCLYGTNKKTELFYEYADGLDYQPTMIHYEDGGDGVVPLQSLLKCLEMGPVASRSFNLVGHGGEFIPNWSLPSRRLIPACPTDLVRDPFFFEEVMKILTQQI